MNKQSVIILRTTEEQKNILKKKALNREITLSHFLLNRAFVNKDLTLEEKEKLHSIMTNIRQIGVNLNQAVRNLNIKSSKNYPLNLEDIDNLKMQIQNIKNNYITIYSFIQKLM